MRYLLISFIIFCMSFSVSFVASIAKKRFAFLGLIFSYLGVTVDLMNKFDISYYNQLFDGIDNMNLYLFISSCVVLIVSVTEAFWMKNKRKKEEVININETEKVYIERDTKIYYFNMLNNDIAYYNQDKKTYVLNNSFRKTLGLDDIELNEIDLIKYINTEDVNSFKTGNQFRIKDEWYEIKANKIAEDEYKIIYKMASKLGANALVGSYKDLELLVNDNTKEYGLALMNIYSIALNIPSSRNNPIKTTKEVREKELRDVILVKYLTALLNGDLKDKIKIYKLGNNEYAFYIEDKMTYGAIERGLLTNQSDLLSYDVVINDKTYTISSKIALAFSTNVTGNNYSVLNACFDTLQLVVSSSYKQNYRIYQKSFEDSEDYKLSDMGIDLDNDIKMFYTRNDE